MKRLVMKARMTFEMLCLVARTALRMPAMLCCGCGGGPPAAPAPPPPPPEQTDSAVVTARDNERTRQRQAASNTILTGSQGDTSKANTAVKTLLGS